MIPDWLLNFYKENQTLTVALVSLIGGALLTKLLPMLYGYSINLVTYFGKIVGGRFGYRSIRNKYLNWVAFQNQDLNLPGMISSGEKPTLEQVFISLEFREENEKNSAETENTKNSFSDFSSALFTKMADFILQTIFKIPAIENISQYAAVTPKIYERSRFWIVQKILNRDYLLLILYYSLVIAIFIIIPSLYLIQSQIWSLYHPIAQIVLAFLAFYFLKGTISVAKLSRESYPPFSYWVLVITPLIIFPFSLLVYKIIFNNHPSLFQWINVLSISTGIIIANWFSNRSRDLTNTNQENKIAAIKIGELIKNQNTIAILGKPGSGKSTYTQFLALTFARAKAQDKRYYKRGILKQTFGNISWYLPVLIPLRKVASFISENKNNTKNIIIEAFRQNVLPSQLREEFTDSYINHMLKKKRVLFLLDGLDEVADNEQFKTVIAEVKGLISNYPGNKFIVTSRYSGWRGGISSEFIEAEVQDLNNDQINNFVDNWYHAIELNRNTTSKALSQKERGLRVEQANYKSSKLKDTLQKVENIRNLANNPLLLSMICFVHYNKTLPEERLSLYQDCSRLLLEQWEIEKGLPKDDIPLSFARKEILMQEIAYAIHSGQVSADSDPKEVTSDKIIPIIKRVLKRFNLDVDQAEILFNKLTERTGIILTTEKYKKLFAFSHLTFQEFYTAQYIHSNNLDLFNTISKSRFSENSHLVGWWREVILLYSSMQKNPTKVINDFYINNPESDDHLRRKLQVSSQCLAEAIENTDYFIEKSIISDLLEIHVFKKNQKINNKIYSLIKNYLFQFSQSSSYYSYSLKASFLNTKDEKNLKKQFEYLLQESRSDIPDIKNAALNTIESLFVSHNLNKYISKLDYITLVGENSLSLTIIIAQFFASNPKELIKKDPDGSLIATIFDQFVNEIEDDENYSEYPSMIKDLFLSMFDVLKSPIFKNHNPRLKTIVINNIREVFEETKFSLIDILDTWKYYSGNFRVIVNSLYGLLINLNESGETVTTKYYLMEILETGSYKQQIIAIDLLTQYHNRDKDSKEIIVNKIHCPNKEIRLAAIKGLQKLKFNNQEATSILDLLRYYEKHEKTIHNVISNIKSLLLGIGSCGISYAERLQITALKALLENNLALLSDQVNANSLNEEVDEWVYIINEMPEHLDETILNKIIDTSLITRQGTKIKLLESLLEKHKAIGGKIKNKAASTLLSSSSGETRYYSLYLVNTAGCKINKNSPEFDCLINIIQDKTFLKRKHCFEILFQSGLVN